MPVLWLKHSALKAVIQNYIQINKRIEQVFVGFFYKKKSSSIFNEGINREREAPASFQRDHGFLSRKTLTHIFIQRASPLVHFQFSSVHRHLQGNY